MGGDTTGSQKVTSATKFIRKTDKDDINDGKGKDKIAGQDPQKELIPLALFTDTAPGGSPSSKALYLKLAPLVGDASKKAKNANNENAAQTGSSTQSQIRFKAESHKNLTRNAKKVGFVLRGEFSTGVLRICEQKYGQNTATWVDETVMQIKSSAQYQHVI